MSQHSSALCSQLNVIRSLLLCTSKVKILNSTHCSTAVKKYECGFVLPFSWGKYFLLWFKTSSLLMTNNHKNKEEHAKSEEHAEQQQPTQIRSETQVPVAATETASCQKAFWSSQRKTNPWPNSSAFLKCLTEPSVRCGNGLAWTGNCGLLSLQILPFISHKTLLWSTSFHLKVQQSFSHKWPMLAYADWDWGPGYKVKRI